MKITFVGDIMCEPLMLKAAKRAGEYDFSGVFRNVRDLFAESDYVIGNLETPLAGEKAVYTSGLLSFNTPDSFADAIKEAGINMVLTANNHCLDRGEEGLKRTLEVLESRDIPYAGTCKSREDRKEAAYFTVGDTRFAIVSYTYGTNYMANRILLQNSGRDLVNLLKPQQEPYFVAVRQSVPVRKKIVNKALGLIPEEKRFYIKKFLGLTVNQPHEDDYLNYATIQPYLDNLEKDITLARSRADYVIFCPHIGGQFNEVPGLFSRYVIDQAVKYGCDAVIASHAHVILKSEVNNGIPCFYSIGNFSMSPGSVYLLHDFKPEYGMAVHLYADRAGIAKVTYTLLKIVEDKKSILTVYPVDTIFRNSTSAEEKDSLMKDIAFLRSRIEGITVSRSDVCGEYEWSAGA